MRHGSVSHTSHPTTMALAALDHLGSPYIVKMNTEANQFSVLDLVLGPVGRH